MPKVIFTCRYLKQGKRGRGGLLSYIGTREGVEVFDYRETFMDYLANRPRTHGLFSDDRVPLVLSKIQSEVAEHKGNIYTSVLSLTREDAERLGYDNAPRWQSLLRSHRNHMAEALRIRPENFVWYAAFHNEGHHPHAHIVCYSKDPSEPYLTNKNIETLRATFAHDIFQQDFENIYTEQNKARDNLKTEGKARLKELVAELSNGGTENVEVAIKLAELSERLKTVSGKKVYGYLPPEIKKMVDSIVDELEKEQTIAAAYALWCEQRENILKVYVNEMPVRLPLSAQPKLKSIRNDVVRAAREINLIEQQAEYTEQQVLQSTQGLVKNLANFFGGRPKPCKVGKLHESIDSKRVRELLAQGKDVTNIQLQGI